MVLGAIAGVPEMAAVAGGAVVAGGASGYALHSLMRRRHSQSSSSDVEALQEAVTSLDQVGLVLPENPSIDAISAGVGLRALFEEWGISSRLFAMAPITGEDAKAFCNHYDVDVALVDDHFDDLAATGGAVAVAGGGSVPAFGNNPPVVAVVRHRPAASDHPVVVARNDDGATSATVAHLLREANHVPEERVATALLYGVRAGTREFRRVRSHDDYEAAAYLHDYADPSQIESLRAPGMGGETFDVIGTAIQNRERQASFAVANVGTVPAISALEEASDTLLRLDGVSSAAVFGVHEGTVVVSCRAESARTSATDVLETAFDSGGGAVGGNADVATARVPLGLFDTVDEDHQGTLDTLIDASTRKALFSAFEST